MKSFLLTFPILCGYLLNCSAQPKLPTVGDLRYSEKFERSELDLWLADSPKPTPLVVNFHGGGFRTGDKRSFKWNRILRNNLSKGVSFASVNYPFVRQVDGNYSKILEHCAESIEFLKKRAAKYNFDPERISVMGNSAGALITCYLGHAKNLGIRSIFPIQQPKGTPMLIPLFRADGSPVIVYNRSGKRDKIHHPDFAIMVREKCKELGVECLAYGVEGTGLKTLSDEESIEELAMKFFQKSWKKKLKKQ